jgi:hypothetical protein
LSKSEVHGWYGTYTVSDRSHLDSRRRTLGLAAIRASSSEFLIFLEIKVFVEGQLENHKWTDKDNIERYSTDVVIRPFHGDLRMLGGKKKNGAAPEQPTPP